MFWQSYKNTLKNLVRSPLFWAMVMAVFLVAAIHATKTIQGYHDPTSGRTVLDTDPDYVMPFDSYEQLAGWSEHTVMQYAMPCLIAVSVMLILNRDYGDSFFEVERAGGVKPASYLFGRLTALTTVFLSVAALVLPLHFYWYYFSRGGIRSLTHPFADSAVRLLRQYCCGTVPVMLMYLGVVYLLGCLLKNGLAAGVGGIAFMLLHILVGVYHVGRYALGVRPQFYDFFNPLPTGKHAYLSYYDRYTSSMTSAFTPTEFWLWFSVMLGFAAAGLAAAYLLTRKREI